MNSTAVPTAGSSVGKHHVPLTIFSIKKAVSGVSDSSNCHVSATWPSPFEMAVNSLFWIAGIMVIASVKWVLMCKECAGGQLSLNVIIAYNDKIMGRIVEA
jgi:hypothetical protein